MATFSNGESGLSVRNKINEAINKVDGVTPFGNNIDVTGTVTADGLTVDGQAVVSRTNTTDQLVVKNAQNGSSATPQYSDVTFEGYNSQDKARIRGVDRATNLFRGGLTIQTQNSSQVLTDRIFIDGDGDISFYEDTGTTPKFFWDASAEALGIGTVSPQAPLHISAAGSVTPRIESSNGAGDAALRFYSGATFKGQIGWDQSDDVVGIYPTTSSGTPTLAVDGLNVGIGTTSPYSLNGSNLEVYDASGVIARLSLHTSTGRHWAIGSVAADSALSFYDVDFSTERMRIDSSGNLLIGGTTAGTASAGNLVLVNGTAPTGNVTNGITLYAEDVSSSSELKVRDEAGNVTTLSPHNFDLIPEGPSEEMAWSYYSERDGKRINVDMLKAIRLLEQITGEKLVHMT